MSDCGCSSSTGSGIRESMKYGAMTGSISLSVAASKIGYGFGVMCKFACYW